MSGEERAREAAKEFGFTGGAAGDRKLEAIILRHINAATAASKKLVIDAEFNCEMADGCLHEIAETLEQLGCCHGHDGKGTPPMMYREWMLCAMKHKVDAATAAAKATITEAVCKEAYERGVAEEREACANKARSRRNEHWRLPDDLRSESTRITWKKCCDSIDAAIRARTPSPAEDSQ